MNAAMNEDIKTSVTPYCWVVSIKSREKAIPGRTLHDESGVWLRQSTKTRSILCKECQGGSRNDSIIPGIRPVTQVPGCTGADVAKNPGSNIASKLWEEVSHSRAKSRTKSEHLSSLSRVKLISNTTILSATTRELAGACV